MADLVVVIRAAARMVAVTKVHKHLVIAAKRSV
jgi:hypothetical protein